MTSAFEMFMKNLPCYQLCSECLGFFRTSSKADGIVQQQQQQQGSNGYPSPSALPPPSSPCENNNYTKGETTLVSGCNHIDSANGATNHDRTRPKENVFEKVIRNTSEYVRGCCWKYPTPPASPESLADSSGHQRQRRQSCEDIDETTEVTNVVPLDDDTVFTPTKNYIAREPPVDESQPTDLLAEEHEEEREEEALTTEGQQQNHQGQSPRSSGDDERLTNCCSTASTVAELELDDGNEENNGKQAGNAHVQKLDLDQRPNLSPSKSYGNASNNSNNSNSSGRFFGSDTGETPIRARFLGEATTCSPPTAAGCGINQESYIIHRDEQYDSDNDDKSSNDSTSTRIISNSTFNFGGKGADPYPPTPNISHTPSLHSTSRPQSVTSHKSIGSGILKSEGRLSRTNSISYSNPSIKQSADNISVKSNRSAKSRDNDRWYEREGTPVRSEDVISSNQVQYESDYDDDVEEEVVEPKRTSTPKRYPTPSPHPLPSSYSTEELSNNGYNHVEDTEVSPPKSRVQSASLGNLQQLDDEEEPIQPAPKKILKKPYLVRKSSKVAPVREVVSTVKAKNKMNEVIFQKTLRKFDKPKDALTNCIIHLESPNWEQNINGLQFFVRLIRHHPEVIDTQIHLLSVALAKQVRNLRSQVARAACQASSEFFATHRRAIEGEAEDIATHLLHRTADTNKFLRADATHALESMCENLSTSKVIHIISFKGATHQNAVVRTTAAKLLDKIVRQIGPDRVFTLPRESRDKLVLTGAQLLLEGSLETRNYTKSMFKQLSEHPSYNKVLLEVIPPRTYRNIEKSLKSIKQM